MPPTWHYSSSSSSSCISGNRIYRTVSNQNLRHLHSQANHPGYSLPSCLAACPALCSILPAFSIGHCGLFVRLPLLVWVAAVDDDNLHVKSIRSMLSSFLPTQAKACPRPWTLPRSFYRLDCFFADSSNTRLPYSSFSHFVRNFLHCIFCSFFVSKFPAGYFFPFGLLSAISLYWPCPNTHTHTQMHTQSVSTRCEK